MIPEDLSRIVAAETPVISGGRVAYVRSQADLETDGYARQIWLQDLDVGHRRLTIGPEDKFPRWSPDGGRIAFVRKTKTTTTVGVIPVDGGEPVAVAEFPLGVEELQWSPDGERLAAVAITWAEEWDGLDDEARERKPRRISQVPYRFDRKGWIHDRHRHVWLIDMDGESSCLTPGDSDESQIAWSPDGRRIAFLSDRDARKSLTPGIDVWEVDVETAAVVKVVAQRGNWHVTGYSPDGDLHLIGRPEPMWPKVLRVYRREDDGALTDLTGHLDRSPFGVGSDANLIRWRGDTCVVGFEDSGRAGLVGVSPDGEVETLVDGDRVVGAFDADETHVTFVASTTTTPSALFVTGPDGERPLSGTTGEVELNAPEHFTVTSDGVELDVWVHLPSGTGPVPVLLNIHGGPAAQYGFGFFDEFQVYAGAGFGVVATNPRGSSGRGEEFLTAVTGSGWGEVDHRDVIAALDAALDRYPRLDGDRQGVMGGSYGGFMTAWLIARESRFSSAIVERGLLSWNSFAGTSDIAAQFPTDYTGFAYPDAWDRWWEMSPLATAHEIETPTLIIHSEEDHRCPIEQAEQLFMALLRNGTETEFLRFPCEGHELSRSGSPSHRLERFEAIIDWHRRWLM